MSNTNNILQTDTFEQVLSRYDELIPWYKDELREPFVRSGKGYMGVVLKSKVDDSIMCNDCGMQYQKLSTHVMVVHDYESFAQYKERHGYAQNIPRVSERLSQIQRQVAIRSNSVRNIEKYRTSGKGKPKKHKYTTSPISKKNKSGTCSLPQIKHRMDVLASIVGRSPTSQDARKYDSGLVRLLCYKYGSWNKGKKLMGFTVKKQNGNKQYSDEDLVAILRKFVIDKKVMPSKTFIKTMGMSVNTFSLRFGSWNRAKMMADLDQLLMEVKNAKT